MAANVALTDRRENDLADLRATRAEMRELGIPVYCGSLLTHDGEPCDAEMLSDRLRCHYHRFDIPSSGGARAMVSNARDVMAAYLLPKAMTVVDNILDDDTASYSEQLRASTIVMDRVGLVAGSALTVEATVQTVPPAEKLVEALSAVRARMGLDVVPGDVVDATDAPDGADG